MSFVYFMFALGGFAAGLWVGTLTERYLKRLDKQIAEQNGERRIMRLWLRFETDRARAQGTTITPPTMPEPLQPHVKPKPPPSSNH